MDNHSNYVDASSLSSSSLVRCVLVAAISAVNEMSHFSSAAIVQVDDSDKFVSLSCDAIISGLSFLHDSISD